MNLLQSFVRSSPSRRSLFPYDPAAVMNFNGITYPLTMPQQTLGFKEEEISPTYVGLAEGAFSRNSVVFSIMERRRQVFSQARFQWQQIRGGTPGRLFGTDALSVLEAPWPGATTGDLLGEMLQQADLAGNAFIRRSGNRLKVLRSEWVTIVAGSDAYPDAGASAIDAEVIGYVYHHGGRHVGAPVFLLPEEVAHFIVTPDPFANFRGMSWLSAAIRDVMGDNAASTHKLMFFQNGATPNMVVSLDAAVTKEKFDAWVEKMDQGHVGLLNAYKTLYLGGGAEAKVVGADFKQLDFKITQGAGETRIAAAGSVPPIIAGFSEGLQSATYSNYGQARRAFSDVTVWDLWRNACGSLQRVVRPPANSRLWVDVKDIPFLQEDEKDRAEIQQMDAAAIGALVTAGYDPSSVVDAVTANDLTRLRHSGLYSVQLQPPGSEQQQEPTEPAADEPSETGRALIHRAEQRLIEAGIKPTVAAIAETLEVSDRTVRRWRAAQ